MQHNSSDTVTGLTENGSLYTFHDASFMHRSTAAAAAAAAAAQPTTSTQTGTKHTITAKERKAKRAKHSEDQAQS
jgi:hypothetical protein